VAYGVWIWAVGGWSVSIRKGCKKGLRMRKMIGMLAVSLLAAEGGWEEQASGVTARLRGVSAVNERVVWASGAGGTIMRSGDGGKTWVRLGIPGAEKLDFRDIDAMDERTAYVLSIGPGEASRIYKTRDAGASWELQFQNREPKAFYDAMTFVSATNGFVIGDEVDGQFAILETRDGGKNWKRIGAERLPGARKGEGAFAASGTNIAVIGKRHIWIGLNSGRVLISQDGGRRWEVADTGLATSESAGIFSIAFRDAKYGIAVGGDYKQEGSAVDNAAITEDGGRTWRLVKGLRGLRSAVAWLPGGKRVLAVGPSGAEESRDGGATWSGIPGRGYHSFSAAPAFSVAPGRSVGWGAGEGGRIGRLHRSSN
jgi:photosystem II stability/assembly factor-like uncharacterized protein